jgi:hypothetical protein
MKGVPRANRVTSKRPAAAELTIPAPPQDNDGSRARSNSARSQAIETPSEAQGQRVAAGNEAGIIISIFDVTWRRRADQRMAHPWALHDELIYLSHLARYGVRMGQLIEEIASASRLPLGW